MIKLYTTTIIFLLSLTFFHSQRKTDFNNFDFNLIKSKITEPNLKSAERKKLILELIFDVKKINDKNLLYDSYALASQYTTGQDQLKYGDSILMIGKVIGTDAKIADAYIAKGMILSTHKDFVGSLDSYLKAYDLLKKGKNGYVINNLEYNIADTKNYLGLHEEARTSLQKTIAFFRLHHDKVDGTDYRLYYMYSLISLIDTNSRTGKFGDNANLINEGKNFIKDKQNADLETLLPYLISSEGMQAYYQKNYQQAIKLLNKSLSTYNDQWNHSNDYFFLGMSYWENGEQDKAVESFAVLDEELDKNGKIDPKFRSAFEKLYEYYLKKEDKIKQFEYIDKLLMLHKVYEKEYEQIFPHLKTKYEIDKLNREKQKLSTSLKEQRYFNLSLIVLSTLLLLGLFYSILRSYRRKKQYKKLYETYILQNSVGSSVEEESVDYEFSSDNYDEKFIDDKEESDEICEEELEEEEVSPSGNTLLINQTLENQVLDKLSFFEKSRKFLDSSVTLKSLAVYCGTNTAYLSKIINSHKKCNYKTYMVNLRLNYTMHLWKSRADSRVLSIQEIATKSGFSTAQSFSKNFLLKYEVSPKYFLQQLNKTQ
ncbi:hypothetical protein ASG31_06965 [Chryseobacterium sp. Leaf404]|uniref:helix-turn-helix domain-containing protein n=1 Tax=unclassified Chryseobacterium TaxID=2593645 RepID=UPI0006F2C6F9|nr:MULTISPECIES: helix-turn-helix domain-containing protein [unclassified Chryseobacterium]KQT18455.1 hypothetical protein ASG31_06965 [Chryseobacterium sp. Leaf404]